MKYLVVIGDGMADNPVEALGGKTPLEYADIPTIDSLAARGTVDSVVNCPKPLPAGSETAILSIFGCDPLKHFSGRSPMEAAAIGQVGLVDAVEPRAVVERLAEPHVEVVRRGVVGVRVAAGDQERDDGEDPY